MAAGLALVFDAPVVASAPEDARHRGGPFGAAGPVVEAAQERLLLLLLTASRTAGQNGTNDQHQAQDEQRFVEP